MRRAPSSALTFFLKWVCPSLWIVGIGLPTCLLWFEACNGIWPPYRWMPWEFLVVWLVGTGFLLWFRGRLNRVDREPIGSTATRRILVGIAILLGVVGLISLLWPVMVWIVWIVWINGMGAPAEQRVACIVAKLRQLNPGFDPLAAKLTYKFENGKVTELSFKTDYVTDISPVAPLEDLRKLSFDSDFGKSMLQDISPLRGLQLASFSCRNTKVSDLSPLTGMPLRFLHCNVDPKRDTEILRSIKTLEKINDVARGRFLETGGGRQDTTTARLTLGSEDNNKPGEACRSTGPERGMVVDVLRLPCTRSGFCRSHGPSCRDCGHDHRILAQVVGGGHPDAAAPGLGQLRQPVELHDLAAEWVNHFSSASTTEVSTCRSGIDQYFFSSRSFFFGRDHPKPVLLVETDGPRRRRPGADEDGPCSQCP